MYVHAHNDILRIIYYVTRA